MATANPFDLLGDDAEDPSQLIAAEQIKAAAAPKKEQPKPASRAGSAQQNKPAQLPSKPLPPSQAVREAKNDAPRGGRGGSRGGGRGRGHGGSGFNRDFSNDENSSAPASQGAFEEGDTGNPSERRGYGGPRGPYRGGRRGGFSNGEAGEEGRPRRAFERRSGTGRGSEIKREGSGRGNWGTQTDEIAQVTEEVVNETEKNLGDEKPSGEDEAADGNKDSPANENEEKEPEDKEMTLEEYEKLLEEKRKALQGLKTEVRKVDTKEFETMQPLSNKKDNDEIFIKLGSDKDKRKDAFEKEERSKKSVSINEFLKPAEGERYYNPGGRGRGRGRGSRGGYGGNAGSNVLAPSIEDPGQFPSLGFGK
ncbi:RGG repeats nuclear RNA binding protein A-like [Abrus precatorius]|uniref:RGG repeats nuclear RNA binding protein A-like n=1 Tax=Abrus precatorius TaxID=3816 RepID=A0A8B8JSK3_ABRPR|nr:RGG repeats nuclear RNA binding protein A-like [Abrus precatorius]